MKISPKKSPFSDLKPHKINQLVRVFLNTYFVLFFEKWCICYISSIYYALQVSSPVTTSKLMSAYSMNMARAIRWYATTGDLGHILTRMRHLMVCPLEFLFKINFVFICIVSFFFFFFRQCKVKMETSKPIFAKITYK
jgi:hypothetical protein